MGGGGGGARRRLSDIPCCNTKPPDNSDAQCSGCTGPGSTDCPCGPSSGGQSGGGQSDVEDAAEEKVTSDIACCNSVPPDTSDAQCSGCAQGSTDCPCGSPPGEESQSGQDQSGGGQSGLDIFPFCAEKAALIAKYCMAEGAYEEGGDEAYHYAAGEIVLLENVAGEAAPPRFKERRCAEYDDEDATCSPFQSLPINLYGPRFGDLDHDGRVDLVGWETELASCVPVSAVASALER